MKSSVVFPISLHLEPPVSREIDHEILMYLTDEFKKVRESRGLGESWPSEEVINLLVDRTAGLWIYAATIIRFIADENSLGPRDQLRIVVEFAKGVSAKGGTDNPLAEMDFFYTLIMQRVPEEFRTLVRKILFLRRYMSPHEIAGVPGLSEEKLRHSCTFIQLVVKLQGSDLRSIRFHFYHASFPDFMKDPAQSKDSCIHSHFPIGYRRERLDWLYQVCSRSAGPSDITFPSDPEGWDFIKYYSINLIYSWFLCCEQNHPFDLQTFRMMLELTNGEESIRPDQYLNVTYHLPTELRDKIIRDDKCPAPGCTNTNKVWILGHGENETGLVWPSWKLSI